MTTIEEKTTWNQINLLARSYVDLQQSRTGAEHRLRKLTEFSQIQAGVAKQVIEITKREGSDKEIRTITHEITDEDGAEQVMKTLQKSAPYLALARHQLTLQKEEKDLLRDISLVTAEHPLWKWCERVKGLGQVAAMTFLGFINPEITPTVGHLWAYCGFTPDSRLKKGEQAHYNPLVKGRTYLMGRNVVMQQDQYYAVLWKIKKEYIAGRPDFMALLEAKKPGTKARINNMSIRWLIKILLSHAYEIIMTTEGKTVISDHHPHIPIKPVDENEQKKVITEFRKYHQYLAEEQKKRFAAGQPFAASENIDVGYREDE